MSGAWYRLSDQEMLARIIAAQIWSKMETWGGNCLLYQLHSLPFWDRKNLKSIRGKLLGTPKSPASLWKRLDSDHPRPVPFPRPQTRSSLPSEARSTAIPTKFLYWKWNFPPLLVKFSQIQEGFNLERKPCICMIYSLVGSTFISMASFQFMPL